MNDCFFSATFLCKLVNSTPVLCITCSIYSMMALSAERYRTIVRQAAGHRLRQRNAVTIAAFIWLFSFCVSIPTIVDYDVIASQNGNKTDLVCKSTLSKTFSVLNGLMILIISYIIPQIVVYVNYGRLVYFIWKKSKTVVPSIQIQIQQTQVVPVSAVSKHKVRIIKMLLLAAALFTISWIPYFVLGTISVSRTVITLILFICWPHMGMATIVSISRTPSSTCD